MPKMLQIGSLMRGKVVIEGKTRKKNSSVSNTKIQMANDKLANMGVLGNGVKQKNSTPQMSQNVLAAIGCSIDTTTDRDFSLLTQQTDTEVIQNPNIIDETKWAELKNEKITALDKFPSVDDNFFKPDYPISITAKDQWLSPPQAKEVVKNSSEVVKDILRINLKTPYKRTLPQFK